jgi:murein L,D-transpeptidase YafK
MEDCFGTLMFTPPSVRQILLLVSLLLAVAPELTRAAEVPVLTSSASPDRLLTATLDDIRANRSDSALASINRLIAMRPDFKLAYLIKGDILLAKTRVLPDFGGAQKTSSQSLDDLRDEARVRLLSHLDQPTADQLPAQILQLAPDQQYAMLADASRARIYVFENNNGEPHLIHDYYLSLGKNGIGKRSEGDKRSPLGVYSFNSELPSRQLTPFYGAGAFQIDYPNPWDAMHGSNGHGIWLHGVPPDTYSRPPKTSEGCLVVTNPDWKEIARYITPDKTPLVIVDHSDWLDRDAWLAKRNELLGVLNNWKDDWQKLDANDYLAHYSPDYLSNLGAGWVTGKQKNITQKSWIRVELTDVSLFQYSDGNSDMAVFNITQRYNSDKLSDVTRKQIYLRQEQGQWRIAYEKALQSTPAVALQN